MTANTFRIEASSATSALTTITSPLFSSIPCSRRIFALTSSPSSCPPNHPPPPPFSAKAPPPAHPAFPQYLLFPSHLLQPRRRVALHQPSLLSPGDGYVATL